MNPENLNIHKKLTSYRESIFATMSRFASQHNALNLSQGFPDFQCPPKLMELVNHYMKEGHNQYAPMPGLPRLKEKIAGKVEKLYGSSYDPDSEITITAGATQAIFLAISSLIHEDDEVILFEPAYDCYAPAISLQKGRPIQIPLSPPDYKIDWEKVKKRINYRTKMIIINTPHNPSGTIMSDDDMKQLQKLTKNTDIIVLSDEVYEHIIFDNNSHNSVCRYPGLKDRSLAIFSFGKTYHTTGWKMGYVLAPPILTNQFRKVYQYGMFACFTPVQHAYADFLDYEDHYLELPAFYQKKREFFREAMKESRFEEIPCSGTYFQCYKYDKISNEKDMDFVSRLTKEHGVAAIPVSVFYKNKEDHKVIRLCFAKEEETLEKAAETLCKL